MAKSEKTSHKLSMCLKNLHLPGIREYYLKITEEAVKNSMSYEEYLLALLETECEVRFNKRIYRLMRESGLPEDKRMDNFDMKRLPLKITQQIKALMDGSFLKRTENVLIFGNPGSGKTHLVCAISRDLINQNRRILFTTCSILVQELLIAKRDLLLPKVLKKFAKFDAIIIDDIGYVQQAREEMEVLFTFLADRYERSSIIITSNLPFSKWDQIFKDTMITAAAIDRLVHHSVIVEMNIKSYRMENAKKKIKNKKGGDKS
jgi:DNA replication protein DnaC